VFDVQSYRTQYCTFTLSAQEKKHGEDSIAGRLRRLQVSQGLPWRRVAERLGISQSMVMMVLRGERHLSAKAIFRLAEAERQATEQKSAADQIVEHLIGGAEVVAEVLGRGSKGRGAVEVAVGYVGTQSKTRLPAAVSLVTHSEEACRKLRTLFAETLDTRVIALACLPEQLRSEKYLDHLTSESKARLTNAALGLVIPDWRTLVVKGVEQQTGTK
jgi:transcriptional regulator with XRE-family HTH domain